MVEEKIQRPAAQETSSAGILVHKIPILPFFINGMFFILYFNNKLKNKPGMIAGQFVV
jgi:type III secretory pathway component EscT